MNDSEASDLSCTEWSCPPGGLSLGQDEIHLWQCSLEQPENQLDYFKTTLSQDELARADRYHFERDSLHFIAARGVLRSILGLYIQVNPAELVFSYGKHGKPRLEERAGANIMFNLSHSKDVALYAFSGSTRLGVDIEYIDIKHDFKAIAKRFFSPGEFTSLESMPEEKQLNTFYAYWTCKEAYLKAVGEGIYHPLDKVEIALENESQPRLFALKGDVNAAALWSLARINTVSGYAAALAFEGDGRTVKCWQWNGNA